MLNVLILKQKYPNPVASQPYSTTKANTASAGHFAWRWGISITERPAFPFPAGDIWISQGS